MNSPATGCFENDVAHRWAEDFARGGRLERLEEALDAVLDVDRPGGTDVCVALAAAEVVAAMHGRQASDLPTGLKTWVTEHNQASNPERLRERASAAVVRIAETPPLRDLVGPRDHRDRWVAALRDLDRRLQTSGE